MAFRLRELPDDLIADVLRRLPPRSLAVSRCACRAWRDLIDDQRLLRKDLLPRSVGGIFIGFSSYNYSGAEFLARPTTGPSSISSSLDFVPGILVVVDHCNGLVLCLDVFADRCVVANPATRQWAWLPLPTPQMRTTPDFRQNQWLVYDPAVSPHYHVLLIGSSASLDQQHKSALQVYVYSSSESGTGRWEDKWFAPEQAVPVPAAVAVQTTTIAIEDDTQLKKVYWRGRLYLLCKNTFILRISISNANYRKIPTPEYVDVHYPHFCLGRSKNGVYCAYGCDRVRFQIFLLNESCDQIAWELKHSGNLNTFARKLHESKPHVDQPNAPWILEDINYCKNSCCGNDRHKEVVKDTFEWNSDDDNVLSTEDMVQGWSEGCSISLLGFHPYKEVVFLNACFSRAVAYHWNTSKFQDLGNVCPTYCLNFASLVTNIEASFIYTPCWMEDFPKTSSEAPIED